jgi:hypothetical protein
VDVDPMMMRSALCCVVLLAFTTSTWGAEKPATKPTVKAAANAAPKKPAQKAAKAPPTTVTKAADKRVTKAAAKPVAKAVAKPATKPATKGTTKGTTKGAMQAATKGSPKVAGKAAALPAAKPVTEAGARPAPASVPRTFAAAYTPASIPPPTLQGKTETLTCRDGTEDRHARIGVVLVGGKVDSFAYYSKWKPRTCSIYLQRNRDPYSKWIEKGNVTNVNLERGLLLIEHEKGVYRFVFRDIDRERYCGMDGTINGTLTIRKGIERCELTGIMEEGVPLGQAYAYLEESAPAAAPADVAPEPTPQKRVARRIQREPQSAFPSAAVNSD